MTKKEQLIDLADAIFEGSILTLPGNGRIIGPVLGNKTAFEACALGAAMVARMVKGRDEERAETLYDAFHATNIGPARLYGLMEEKYPILLSQKFASPVDDISSGYLEGIIFCLNDNANWPRPKIAQWLRELAEEMTDD